MANKTKLIFTKEFTLHLIESIGHGTRRARDVSKGPDGTTTQSTPMASLTLQNPRRVKNRWRAKGRRWKHAHRARGITRVRTLPMPDAAVDRRPVPGPEEDAASLRSAALEAARGQHLTRAIELLDLAIRCSPSHTRWRLDLATLQYADGRWADCIGTLERIGKAGPLPPVHAGFLARALLQSGRELRDSGCLAEAVEAFERCFEVDPSLAEAHTGLAEVFGATGYPFLERDHREQAVRLAPEDRQARVWLARSYFHTGDTGACLEALGALLDYPDSSEIRSERLHVLLHHPEQTADALRTAHEQWMRDARDPKPLAGFIGIDPTPAAGCASAIFAANSVPRRRSIFCFP